MPSANVRTTVDVKAGVFANVLTARRRYREFAFNHSEPIMAATPPMSGIDNGTKLTVGVGAVYRAQDPQHHETATLTNDPLTHSPNSASETAGHRNCSRLDPLPHAPSGRTCFRTAR